MREFELTLRIRNNLIRSRRTAMGLSPRKLGQLSGVSYEVVLRYESMAISPLSKRQYGAGRAARSWRPSARSLAAFFGVSPEELWPDAVLAVQKTVLTKEVGAKDLLLTEEAVRLELTPESPRTPEDILAEAEAASALADALSRLPKGEREVLQTRFWSDKTLAEIGEESGVKRERVRQKEAKGLRMLRHPSRSGPIARALGITTRLSEEQSPWPDCASCQDCEAARAASPSQAAWCEAHRPKSTPTTPARRPQD